MKSLILFAFMSFVYAGGFKEYKMDNNLFSLQYPDGWRIERNKESDERNGIYKVVFINPLDNKMTLTVKYYSPKSGKNYKKFVETQSSSVDGSKETPTEKYETPKDINILNRKAIEINRKLKEFESMDSSSPSYWLKERIIVFPAKKGFYTLIFSAPQELFDKNIKLFDDVLKSLKLKY